MAPGGTVNVRWSAIVLGGVLWNNHIPRGSRASGVVGLWARGCVLANAGRVVGSNRERTS